MYAWIQNKSYSDRICTFISWLQSVCSLGLTNQFGAHLGFVLGFTTKWTKVDNKWYKIVLEMHIAVYSISCWVNSWAGWKKHKKLLLLIKLSSFENSLHCLCIILWKERFFKTFIHLFACSKTPVWCPGGQFSMFDTVYQ